MPDQEALSAEVSIVAPDSTRGIYEAALARLETSAQDAASTFIEAKMVEIRRAQLLVDRLKAQLNDLLSKSPEELAELALQEGEFPATSWPNIKASRMRP